MGRKGWKKDEPRSSTRGVAALGVADGVPGAASAVNAGASSSSSSSSPAGYDDDGGGGGILARLRNILPYAAAANKVDDMTMYEILTTHPLIRYGKYVFVPMLLYYSYFYFQLQHPEYVHMATFGYVNLRPSLHGNTDLPRQLLIVSSPMSHTHVTSVALRRILNLEVGHETTTDATWNFVRDGSLSWMHGIRYFDRPNDDKELVRAVSKICHADRETHSHMGNFHPNHFGSSRLHCKGSGWNECWKSECFLALLDEWGCGLSTSTSTSTSTTNNGIDNTDDRKDAGRGGRCRMKFARTLHQVRNPMHVLEDLISSHCIGGLDGVVSEHFLSYASALFPYRDYRVDSCIEATGTFLVSYLETMNEAMLRGDIDGYYHIEDSSACDVAEAAGLLSPDTTVYVPNHVRIGRLCDGNDDDGSDPAALRQMTSLEKKSNDDETIDSIRHTRLGWNDLRSGMYTSRREKGDKTLQRRMMNVFAAFMYDEKLIPLQYEPTNVRGISKGEL